MKYLAVILGAYLIGSSSMAFYLGKLKRLDLSKNGSGNLGASNALILLGWKAGVLVGLHDIGKGVLAVLLSRWIFPELEYGAVVAGVACVMGHMFPFYLGFKGGKGFASYLGMTIALNWKLALAVLLMVVVATLVTDYIVAATTATILSVPVAMGILMGSILPVLILAVASVTMLFKHRENYARICSGTEAGLRRSLKGEYRMK